MRGVFRRSGVRFGLCVCAVLATMLALASVATAATLTVTTTGDPDNTNGSCATGGACSLREAVNQANADNAGDTIILPASTTPYTLANGPLSFTASATLAGPLASSTFISGSHASGIITVASPASVIVSGVTLEDGTGADRGGAVFVGSGATATLSQDTLSGNTAPNGGGGVEDQGTLTVFESAISGNTTRRAEAGSR